MYVRQGGRLVDQAGKGPLLFLGHFVVVRKLRVRITEAGERGFQQIECIFKASPIYILEREKECRPLIHPLCAKHRLFADVQSLK